MNGKPDLSGTFFYISPFKIPHCTTNPAQTNIAVQERSSGLDGLGLRYRERNKRDD